MKREIAWDIIPQNTLHGIPGASLVEIGEMGLYTEPLSSAEPNGPAAWGVEIADSHGGAIHLRAGIAPSAERARAAAEAAAQEVEAAVVALYAAEVPSGMN